MFRKIAVAAAFLVIATVAFAYNPPAGGENLFGLSEPELLTSASSSAGGGLFSITPASVVYNPALTASEQRIVLDVAYTALLSSEDPDYSYGSAFQLGLLVPTKWCSASVVTEGIFSPFAEMQLGNSMNLKAAVSKSVTDKLSVGLGIGTGAFWGYDTDWTATADIGVLYDYGDIAFLKKARIGISLLNVGKPYTSTTVEGIYGDGSSEFPEYCTLRTGIAGTVFAVKDITGGVSADIAVPAFQNFVFDAGFQVAYKDMIKLSTAWEFNTREFLSGSSNLLPSIGLSFKFVFNTSESSYLSKKGWQQNEMTVSGAGKHLYSGINAVSSGAVMKLGLQDTEAPQITLWEDSEEGNK